MSLPMPKGHIPAAGLELDKLIAEKVLGWYQDSDIGGPRAWWFEKGKSDKIMGSGPYPTKGEINMAPTAPHSICLAALFYASEDIANE